MKGYTTLDLAALPAPQAVQPWAYDAVLAARMATYLHEWDLARAIDTDLPAYDVDKMETDPAKRLQRAGAMREGLMLQRVNEAVLAVMWASAIGSDLDQLGALVGLKRRALVEADPTAVPPVEAVMESDDEYRARGPIALDATAIGYSGGTYRSIVLQAAPEVKAIAILRPGGGRIDLVLQGRGADGSVADDVVARVRDIVLDNDELTDIVAVRSAVPKPYDIVAEAIVPSGPAIAPVKAASEAALATAAVALQESGATVPTDALIAAGRVAAMRKFTLISPAEDFVVADDEIAWARSIAVDVRAQ